VLVPLTPLDYEGIRQLIARYNIAIDFGGTGSWADCFTPDGVFICTPEDGPLGGRHEGRDALVAYAATHHELTRGRARHWNWNLLIDGEGDRATLVCYLAAYAAQTADRPPVLRATGVYHDRLVRHDGTWRFAERHVHLDPQPASPLP
jgi:hypothetical protein